jgi:uncharacterized protein
MAQRRAVLDPNVHVSAVISSKGYSAKLRVAWLAGRFELIVSPILLNELEDVLKRPKFGLATAEVAEYLDELRGQTVIEDPPDRPAVSRDPDDDYLVALAQAANADFLVSGDSDLTDLDGVQPPIVTPREFYESLTASSGPRPSTESSQESVSANEGPRSSTPDQP